MRLLTGAVLCALCFQVAAQEKPEFQLKRDTPLTGSHLLSTGAKSIMPFDKPYAELTQTQQQILKEQYESMSAGDEPPYPIHGTKDIWKSLIKGSDRYGEHGTLRIIVDVDSDGTATKATVLEAPGEQLATYMSTVLLKQHYKSALCAGGPCSQQFKFEAGWVSD
jgi:hypothetical protein